MGYYRRNHFVPVPEVASLADLNAMVDQWTRPTRAADCAPYPHRRRVLRRGTAPAQAALIVFDGRNEVARHERLGGVQAPAWSWTTTWRRCCASRAPSLARPR